MPGKTVLVVDDEVSVQEALQDILEDNGYRVERASNGEEGLEKDRGNKACCCIIRPAYAGHGRN